MNIDKLERANILAKSLIPKVDELLNMSSKSNNGRLADAIWGLSECDEEFKTKFKQLLTSQVEIVKCLYLTKQIFLVILRILLQMVIMCFCIFNLIDKQRRHQSN